MPTAVDQGSECIVRRVLSPKQPTAYQLEVTKNLKSTSRAISPSIFKSSKRFARQAIIIIPETRGIIRSQKTRIRHKHSPIRIVIKSGTPSTSSDNIKTQRIKSPSFLEARRMSLKERMKAYNAFMLEAELEETSNQEKVAQSSKQIPSTFTPFSDNGHAAVLPLN
ncbi:hypothetical protein [Candidatus Finniella inopinata]|nr:hypothetical protein [Candidatus Finniella inopinata]